MKRTILTICLIATALLFGGPPVAAQDSTQPEPPLVVIVHASAKVDSLSEAELSHALRGKDHRFELVGLQKQSYDRIIKELARTDDGTFQREWMQLLLSGKRKKKPLLSENLLELAVLVGKAPHAIAVLRWDTHTKPPAAFGVKVVKIVKKK